MDGLPYGSRRMRRTARPSIQIPPLKKRRLLLEDDDGDAEALFADEPEDEDYSGEEAQGEATSEHDEASEEGSDSGSDNSISADEVTALDEQSGSPPTSGQRIKSTGKRKRTQIEHKPTKSPDEESNNTSTGSDSDSDDSSEESSSSSSCESASGNNINDQHDPSNIAESDSSSSFSDVSSDTSTNSSGTSSDKSSNEGTPSGNLAPGTAPKTRGKRPARPPANDATAINVRNRLNGLVHPTQVLPMPSAPGMGMHRTHVRNKRRKETRQRKYLAKLAEIGDGLLTQNANPETIQGNDTRAEEPSNRLAEGDALPSADPSVDATAKQPSDEQDTTQAAKEAFRARLLREVAGAGTPTNQESSSGNHQGGQLDSQHDLHPRDGDEILTIDNGWLRISDAHTQETQIEVKVAPTATTGPRLKIGDAARRLMLAGIDTKPSKKKEPVAPTVPIKRQWQDVIKLSAVECGATDIDLPEPPFPFKQRWHNIPGRLFGKQKKQYMQELLEKYHVSQDGGRKRERSDEDYESPKSAGKEQDDICLTQTTTSRAAAEGQPSGGLNYDEEETSGDSHTLKGPSSTPTEDDQKDADEGYPSKISMTGASTPLTKEECSVGCFITFKQLEVSAKGTPELSGDRTARIQGMHGDTLQLRLARRDVQRRDQEAEKRHAKFHVQDEESSAADDERNLTIDFSDLVDPAVLCG